VRGHGWQACGGGCLAADGGGNIIETHPEDIVQQIHVLVRGGGVQVFGSDTFQPPVAEGADIIPTDLIQISVNDHRHEIADGLSDRCFPLSFLCV